MGKYKSIGIIVAMGKELKLLLPLIEGIKSIEKDGFTIYSGIIGNHDIIAMQCGIGKVNAAVGTLTLLNNYHVDLIINTGVAGGADNSINVMDVIFGKNIAYHDVWCGPGTEYGVASGYPKYFESAADILSLVTFDDTVKQGLICSGDKFISHIDEVNEIKSHYPKALAVDMESATIAQICFLRKVPFLCVRVISDSPGVNHNNSKQYDNFWEDAPKHIFEIVKDILKKI